MISIWFLLWPVKRFLHQRQQSIWRYFFSVIISAKFVFNWNKARYFILDVVVLRTCIWRSNRLHKRVPRFSYGMTSHKYYPIGTEENFCSNLNSTDKSPKTAILNFVTIYIVISPINQKNTNDYKISNSARNGKKNRWEMAVFGGCCGSATVSSLIHFYDSHHTKGEHLGLLWWLLFSPYNILQWLTVYFGYFLLALGYFEWQLLHIRQR